MAASGFFPVQPLNFGLCFNYTDLRKLNTRLFLGFILLMGLGLLVFNRAWGLDRVFGGKVIRMLFSLIIGERLSWVACV
jgi:hypothetical protein